MYNYEDLECYNYDELINIILELQEELLEYKVK